MAAGCAVVSVEPDGLPGAARRALRPGARCRRPVGGLAADSLGARQVGALMFPIAKAYVAEAVLVRDAAIRAAQRRLWDAAAAPRRAGGRDGAGGPALRRCAAARGRAGRRAVRRQLFTGQHRVTCRRISQGSRFEAETGYSRAVVDGRFVFVSGTTGYDYATMTIAPGGVVPQCRQALANIAQALAEAGAAFEHVVRVRYYLLDAADFPPCFPLLREAFGSAPPAATMLVVAGLAAPEMRIEIEATALLPE